MPLCSWRSLQLPPGDRAHWCPAQPGSGPLLYLAWGARHYGAAPVATTLHTGWIYVVVEKGRPQLARENAREPVPAPSLLLIGPDCASGWIDEPGSASRLLVWMWRRPRHPELARLARDTCLRLPLAAESRGRLAELHALTRSEAQHEDADSRRALSGLQLALEAQVVRLLRPAVGQDERVAVTRAQQWLVRHLDSHQPLARLADYLALSPSTVQRIFRQQLGRTVVQVMAELRCREAARLIEEEGVPIKAVAYRLGYRHPHDFSRAYRRATGVNPSSLGRRTARRS